MKETVVAAANDPKYTRKGEGDVVELADGRLLLAYMEFWGDASDFAPTRIVTVDSSDGGSSWKNHRIVASTEPGEMNIYSPNLIRGSDGSILFLYMRQKGGVSPSSSQHLLKSTDEGKTFAPFSRFAEGREYSLCNAVVKRLASGRLLVPVTTMGERGEPPYGGAVLLSDDDGSSWREATNRIALPMRGVMEPHLEETRDARVLMVMRSQLGSLFVSESPDGGESWSLPQTTGLRTPESCPEICRIPGTRDLLMIWNNSHYDPGFRSHFGKRSPLTAAVSRDEGRSWGFIRDIEDEPGRAFSNPGCRFTRGGKAIVNYWTCEYLPDWSMQDVIDLRIAILDTDWFYAGAS